MASNGGVAVNDGHVHGQGAAPLQVIGDITNVVPAGARGGRGGGGGSTPRVRVQRLCNWNAQLARTAYMC